MHIPIPRIYFVHELSVCSSGEVVPKHGSRYKKHMCGWTSETGMCQLCSATVKGLLFVVCRCFLSLSFRKTCNWYVREMCRQGEEEVDIAESIGGGAAEEERQRKKSLQRREGWGGIVMR